MRILVEILSSKLLLSSRPLFSLLGVLFKPIVRVRDFDFTTTLAFVGVNVVTPSRCWILVGRPNGGVR
jgi:hypothetical protein